MTNVSVAGALGLNLFLSAIAGSLARQWGAVRTFPWLAAAANFAGFPALAWVIRSIGLGLGTSLVLILTVLLNVLAGFFFFHESPSMPQTGGIVLGLLAVSLMALG
jgi:multidrug transporter EmrE-like cation transporter